MVEFFLGGGAGQVIGYAEEACEEAVDIAIYYRDAFFEGNGSNGASGVGSYAGECAQGFIGGRKFSIVVGDYLLCAAMHVAGAGVVAQSLP